MSLIYMLSDYQEHGPENIIATADPNRVPTLFKKHFKKHWYVDDSTLEPILRAWREQCHNACVATLAKILSNEPHAPGSHNLAPGWGVPQLTILRLDDDVRVNPVE